MNLIELRQKMTAKLAEAKGIVTGAGEANLTAEQQTKYDAAWTEYQSLKAQVARAEALETEEKRLAEIPDGQKGLRPDPATGAKGSGITDIHDRKLDEPWGSFGAQLKSIAEANMPADRGGKIDPRLLEQKAALGGSASVPSDGGYLIHPTYAQMIMDQGYQTGVLASRCDPVDIGEGSDSLEVPYIDETSRANGQRWGGVQVYRAAEADAVAASKPKIGKMETRLEDLKGLAYATERLLRDSVAMSSIYMRAFSEEFGYVLDDEILNGDGNGRCLGILKSPALVTISKEAGQAAATLLWPNVTKMRSRIWVRSRGNYIWVHNQDIEPAMASMTIPVGTGGLPVYLPASGASGQPYDTLFGRPLIPIEQAETLGTKGDIAAVDLSQYQLVRKGAMEAASSMHVRFIYDEMTFKFTMRVNGQPKWKTAKTPAKGTNSVSPFVALETR